MLTFIRPYIIIILYIDTHYNNNIHNSEKYIYIKRRDSVTGFTACIRQEITKKNCTVRIAKTYYTLYTGKKESRGIFYISRRADARRSNWFPPDQI